MTTEHKYAQVLRWIADGKEIQWQTGSGKWFDQNHDAALVEIGLNDFSPDRYRLKSRTIMIGDVECEAPVLKAERGGPALYWATVTGDIERGYYNGMSEWGMVLASGRAFASAEAARAAHDAITKLLTQRAKD